MHNFPVTISHKNDFYFAVVESMSDIQSVVDVMKADGYSIGKSSIRSLISGTVGEACGFVVVTEDQEAPLPDAQIEVVDSVVVSSSVEQQTEEQKEPEESSDSTEESGEMTSAKARKTTKPKFVPTWEGYQNHISKFSWMSFADYMVECFR